MVKYIYAFYFTGEKMPSTKDFLDSVIVKINYSLSFARSNGKIKNYDCGSGIFGEAIITFRTMMGEYLIYCDGTYFGGIYDDRFMLKQTEKNTRFGLKSTIPYDGAKPMYLVKDLNDAALLSDIVLTTVQSLKTAAQKRKSRKRHPIR